MQFIFIGLGSVLAILFMIQMKKGKKFESIVENLDSNAYPLNSLYSVGFAWSSTKLFRLK